MRRAVVIWAFIAVVAMPIFCHAQTGVTVETGRMFSVSAGAFVLGSSTAMDFSKGPVTLGGALYFSQGGIFEKDLTAALSKEKGRWTVGTYVGTYWYTGVGRDWSWSVSVRRVLR
jgi:hypothetical protein